MECQYSVQVPLGTYETHGLDLGVPLRVHRDAAREADGANRAQNDWATHVRPVCGYKGGLGERFSFIGVTVPECLPERLEAISYANEFAFLYDDDMENLESDDPDGFLAAFGDKVLESQVSSAARPEKKLQAKLLAEMMAIDRKRAMTTMKAWAEFVDLASQARHREYTTLDEFVPARTIDAGELLWFGTLTFGMALTIPDEEYEACMEMARPGYAALGLVNDLYSWDKERRDAEAAGLDSVFNAVWVIMKERSVSEEEAKSICAAEARSYMAAYQEIVHKALADKTLSTDVKVYLEAVVQSYIGNLVWSIYCPRYKEI